MRKQIITYNLNNIILLLCQLISEVSEIELN